MKRYIVWPGDVISRKDMQRHFIGFMQLCKLYGVNTDECINGADKSKLLGLDTSRYIHLHPRLSGNYTLPGEKV